VGDGARVSGVKGNRERKELPFVLYERVLWFKVTG